VTPGEVLLEVDALTSPIPGSFRDITFRLHRGEVLGIGGLVGAQRTELVEAIFGLRSIAAGSIRVNGRDVVIRSPIDAKRLGMALLTEDRRDSGVVPTRSVFENVILAHMPRYANRVGIVDTKRARVDARRVLGRLRVRTPSLRTPLTSLSGGNQQKVLLSRWLLWDPEILILDEPTRGIDVGAKFEIYTIINELAAQGKGIVMISSELPELIGESDRIVVMCRGRLTGIVDRAQADETTVMRLATDFADEVEPEVVASGV
jgi:methyl-galactoside transport system ATP-binding protein